MGLSSCSTIESSSVFLGQAVGETHCDAIARTSAYCLERWLVAQWPSASHEQVKKQFGRQYRRHAPQQLCEPVPIENIVGKARRVVALAIDYHGEDLATALLSHEFLARDTSALTERLGG
jgi:hypothetical protein